MIRVKDKRITELLGIKFPIFQGAMTGVSDHRLAGAVSSAGGLGIIASSGLSAEELRAEIRAVRRMTSQPFAVNLMLMLTNCQELVEVIIEEKVPIITTGAGSPKKLMPLLKAAGIIVIPVIPSASIAKKMAAVGCDAVIVEGAESGGHIGKVSTLVLVQAALQAVTIPIIAAGGIATRAGVTGMIASGAAGVQCGTIFLASDECPISDSYKQKIVEANEVDTVVLGTAYNRPLRVLANYMTEQYFEREENNELPEELKSWVDQAFRAIETGDSDNGAMLAGQSVGLIHEIMSVESILNSLYDN